MSKSETVFDPLLNKGLYLQDHQSVKWVAIWHWISMQHAVFQKTHISADQLWIQLKWKHWSFLKNCAKQNSGIEFSNCQSWFLDPWHIVNFTCKLSMENSAAYLGRQEAGRQGVWQRPIGAKGGRWGWGRCPAALAGAPRWQTSTSRPSPKSGNLHSYVKISHFKY